MQDTILGIMGFYQLFRITIYHDGILHGILYIITVTTLRETNIVPENGWNASYPFSHNHGSGKWVPPIFPFIGGTHFPLP